MHESISQDCSLLLEYSSVYNFELDIKVIIRDDDFVDSLPFCKELPQPDHQRCASLKSITASSAHFVLIGERDLRCWEHRKEVSLEEGAGLRRDGHIVRDISPSCRTEIAVDSMNRL